MSSVSRVLTCQCVCGAMGFSDGEFNSMHKDGKCSYKGGEGADGQGGHVYERVESNENKTDISELREKIDAMEEKQKNERKGKIFSKEWAKKNKYSICGIIVEIIIELVLFIIWLFTGVTANDTAQTIIGHITRPIAVAVTFIFTKLQSKFEKENETNVKMLSEHVNDHKMG